MAKNYYDITLSLAGICQSARLVQQLAMEGQCGSQMLSVSLNSILQTEPPSTLAVYGDDESVLKIGLESLLAMLNNVRRGPVAEITRYTLSLMMLERKLNAKRDALKTLGQRISQLSRQLDHFDLESETLLNALAGIYVDIISPLGPRIQVSGNQSMLQNTLVQAKIRAVLLAGIRAAVLWQQNGGNRWQLMFNRGRLCEQAQTLFNRA